MTKRELVTFLQNTQFEHLSRNEQARLRDYFENILHTLQDAAEGRQRRRRRR